MGTILTCSNLDCVGRIPSKAKFARRDVYKHSVLLTPEGTEVGKSPKTAVLLAMMDASGSMGEWERMIAKDVFTKVIETLRAQYQNVVVRFLVHSTQAKEATEEEFFSVCERGGTRVSTVFALAQQVIGEYPSDHAFIPVHVSDGDNLSSDNAKAVEGVKWFMEHCDSFYYVELDGYGDNPAYYHASTFSTLLRREIGEDDSRLHSVTVKDAEKSGEAVKALFNFTASEKIESEAPICFYCGQPAVEVDDSQPLTQTVEFPNHFEMNAVNHAMLVLSQTEGGITFLPAQDQFKTTYMFTRRASTAVEGVLSKYGFNPQPVA